MKRPAVLRSRWLIPTAALLLAAALAGADIEITLPGVGPATQPGAQPPAQPPAQGGAPHVPTGELTDQQVLESIQKGVDFLLSCKKNDNLETGADFGAPPSQRGGETALALYAMLHVGRSLDDPRLNAKSAELAPVIKWLAAITPEATYAAALQANALALVPKRPETDAALLRDRDFLFGAMGADGGYSYGKPGNGEYSLRTSWQKYIALKLSPRAGDQALSDAKWQLDSAAREQKRTYGGLDAEIKVIAEEIRDRGKDAMAQNDRAAANRAATELTELSKYADEARRFVVANDFQQELADARRGLADAQQRLRNGDPEHKKSPADLKQDVEVAQWRVGMVEWEAKKGMRPTGDLSNGQYGTLGAWALADQGVEIPVSYWQITDRFWRTTQNQKGTWGYLPDGSVLGEHQFDTMGLAGVASLFISTEYTDLTLRAEPKADPSIDRGLAWLTANFKPDSEDYYYLYGVERVGLASGLKFFGTTNWYRQGAKNIIRRQQANGSWDGGFIGANPVVATAYAILFLARGRDPVVFNKLDYDAPGVLPGLWNVRPRDDANITGWMSKKFERPINWQIVNLQVSPDEWLDAPILLITGGRDPKFKPADIVKLRAFVQAGGLIFSVAEGGQDEFTASMKRYASQVVENRYEMRELPKDSPVFNLWAPIASPPRMSGMSNGIRLLWVHSAVDMDASWQRRAYANKDHFEIPSNLYFYATGKGSLRTKLQPLVVAASPDPAARTITLARLEYPGNCDPEPGAWPRMAKLAQADFHTELHLVTLKPAQLKVATTPVVHMTGTAAFTMPADDAKALQAYLNAGGTLIVDAAGGSADFNTSFQQLVKDLAPGATLTPLPPDHPMYKGAFDDGGDISQTVFRPYAILKEGRMDAPRLQAIMLNGRPAIIYSPQDLTSGLLGTNTWGIIGYTPESAEKVVRNVLLYVSAPPAATQAAPQGATQPATVPAGPDILAVPMPK